jgi:hypothetical protein
VKSMRTLRYSAAVLVAAVVVSWTAGRASGIGFYLGETKEELKLKYDVVVHDHGDGRVTIEFTLADEGRLKPLDEVQFYIQAKQPDKGGGYAADLLVSIDMVKTEGGGKRVGRVEILNELAERAEIVLNTHTLDGKTDLSTRLHHAIPIAKYMKSAAPAAPAAKPEAGEAPAAAPAPAATEGKK